MLPAAPGVAISREHLSRGFGVPGDVTLVNCPLPEVTFAEYAGSFLVALFLENAPSAINYLKTTMV